MTAIGIMQGRLSPPEGDAIQAFPRESWEQEFERAAAAGLAAIEWIYDTWGEEVNPIGSDPGLERIQELSREAGVEVRSVCADWFMDRRLVQAEEEEREQRIDRVEWLLDRSGRLGIGRVVLPFVDDSRLADGDERAAAVRVLERALPAAEAAGVEIHLETDLDPDDFSALLDGLPHELVKVNYDSGNSASLGYSAAEELEAYGERIGSVHIKDRVRGGGSVPLGEGDADLDAVFAGLRKLSYAGDLILQVARGEPGDEVAWATRNREMVEHYLEPAR
jgi:L-ribulose-5-phosphate 3-epimerase